MEHKLKKYCMSQQHGDEIYNTIYSHIEKGKEVCLDFEKVVIVSAVFLNRAIGRLYKNFENPENYLQFINLSDFQHSLIKRVMTNSRWYFASEKNQKIVDKVISEYASFF